MNMKYILIRVFFLFTGLIPLVLGHRLEILITSNPYMFPRSVAYWLGFAVLAVWFVLGMMASKFMCKKWEALVFINFFAVVVFAYMLIWQLGIFSSPFTFPRVNLAMQNYTLSLIHLTNLIVVRLLSLGRICTVTPAMLVGVGLGFMVVASWLGWHVGCRIHQQYQTLH